MAVEVLHCMWTGGIGGAERAVYQLVREQIETPGIEPGLLFARGEGEYFERARELDCPVLTPQLGSGHDLMGARRAALAMRSFDLHHFHSAEPVLFAASLRTDARRVYTHRAGYGRFPAGKRLRHELVGAMLRRRFDALSGGTEHAADAASRLFRIDRARFLITYNGLDFDLLEPRSPAGAVRAALGIGAAEFVVGTTANLRPWKRVDLLLRAVAATEGTDVRALIVGDGPDRPRLERLAADLSLGERAVFTGWREEVADLVAALDAFCMPSSGSESFGNSAVEAMALGVPTIVFADGGGLLEHVVGGETGFVVGDLDGLTATIARLRDDPALASEVGARGRAFVRDRYTVARAVAGFTELYRTATDGAGSKIERRIAGVSA